LSAFFYFKLKNKSPALKGLVIALDDIRDPGNLGTIIRLCDWFGIEQIICQSKLLIFLIQKSGSGNDGFYF
jgi:tRNA G18 (ribose-2'-O)-methylase SpoU